MTTEPESEFFKDRKEAHDWLEANGYKVSVGKFYQDIKKKGFPVLKSDKTVSKYEVAVYGMGLQKDQASDPTALQSSGYQHKKDKADAEIAEMKAAKMKREEDSLWLHADDAWSAIGAVIGRLRDSIRHHQYLGCTKIVLASGGDQSRSAEVFETMDALIDDAFNEVADSDISVTWEDEA